MTLPPDLNVYVSAALFVLGAYVFALYSGLVVWAVRDIRSRSRDVLAQIMVAVLVALFTVPGLLVYLLLRPHSTLAEEYERSLTEEAILQDLEERRICPGCQRHVEPDYIVCPYCHEQLRLRCVGCGRLLSPTWDVCPYCGLFRDQEGVEVEEPREKEEVRVEAIDATPAEIEAPFGIAEAGETADLSGSFEEIGEETIEAKVSDPLATKPKRRFWEKRAKASAKMPDRAKEGGEEAAKVAASEPPTPEPRRRFTTERVAPSAKFLEMSEEGQEEATQVESAETSTAEPRDVFLSAEAEETADLSDRIKDYALASTESEPSEEPSEPGGSSDGGIGGLADLSELPDEREGEPTESSGKS